MNTGIVMIGFALVLLSVGLISTPSSAAVQDNACSPYSGNGIFSEDSVSICNGMGMIGMMETTMYPGASLQPVCCQRHDMLCQSRNGLFEYATHPNDR